MFKKQIETVKTTVRNNKPALIVGAVIGVGVGLYITRDTKLFVLPKANTYFEATPEAIEAMLAGTTIVYETVAGNFAISVQK